MTNNQKKKIIVIDDAKGINYAYKSELQGLGYDITMCFTGIEGQALIDKGEKFDLAILDIVLPAEDPTRYTLTECQETGLRLIKQMVEKEICHSFYVITVRTTLKNRIEKLAKEKGVNLKFEYKLDYKPEDFVRNVEAMLAADSSQ